MGLYAKGSNYRYKYFKSRFVNPTRNVINQEFSTTGKNKIWFGDITHIRTHEGNLYLSVFIDLFTRKIVGYSLKSHMRESLVLESLQTAIKKERPKAGLIIHTDQGSQYTSHNFVNLIIENNFVRSNSNRGNPYDNALMESFFKTFKREVLPKRDYKNKKYAKLDIINFLEVYYNKKRYHSSLGYLTPLEFENLNS